MYWDVGDQNTKLFPLEKMIYIMRSHARLLLLHMRPHTTGFQLLNHEGFSDIFSEYLLPNVMCKTTETIESMETLMHQGKVNAEWGGGGR